MRCLINNNTDVFYDFAVEEYFINNFEEPVFILWKNKPTVMVGRNQNTYKEVNEKFCKENDIKIVRRLSGGGAIYTSLENLQYTLIVNKNDNKDNSFKSLARPLINFLETLGINARFTGRNDILIEDKKISGNAQYHYKDLLLHHGSILFDVNIDFLTKSLTPDLTKLTSKGIESVKSRVTTIKERLEEGYDVDRFIKEFMNFYLEKNENANYKELTHDEKTKILEYKKERWDSWEWNFGKNPKFSNTKKKKFPSGLVEVNYEVNGGKIKKIKIYGDFFSEKDINELEEKLININLSNEELSDNLKSVNVNEYINGVSNKELIDLIVD